MGTIRKNKEDLNLPKVITDPEVGRFYSMWERKSPRHKWEAVYAYALCTSTRVDGTLRFVSFQTSESGGHGFLSRGWSSMMLSATRQLRFPMFDVRALRKQIA